MATRPNNRRGIERGLLVGAALGALYVATRPRTQERAEKRSKLVDWGRVEENALNMVRRMPSGEIADRPAQNQRYRAMVERSTQTITSYTGMHLAQPLNAVFVFDRQDWIRANLEGFERLFGRIEEIQDQLRPNNTLVGLLVGEANKQVVSAQLGLLVGYLARRVLGQYDLSLLGKEAVTTGNLYFVEPNIARIQRDLALPGDDLRMWIALHETTHAYEFEGNPWLRDHFNSLLEDYFQNLNQQVKGLRGAAALKRIAARLREDTQREGWMEIVMSDEQRVLFRKLQGIMSLLEGYSNHIMNTIGKDILPNFALIKERIEGRQKKNALADKLFARLTGLNVKLEQYRLGEIFVNEVVSKKGIDFMNKVWTGPEALPTMEEIRQPTLWIRRIEEHYV